MIISNMTENEYFYGNYNNFKMTAKLVPTGQQLLLKIQDLNTLDCYSQTINQQYIKGKYDFTNIFQEPIEIFDYLTHHFQQVKIQIGVIYISYIFGTRNKRVKNIEIQLPKQEYDQIQLNQLKIKKIKHSFSSAYEDCLSLLTELEQKQAKYIKLEKYVSVIQKQNQELRDTLQEKEDENQQLIKRLRMMKYQLKQKNKEHNKAKVNWIRIQDILPGKTSLNIIAQILFTQVQNRYQLNVILGDETGTVTAVLQNDPLIVTGKRIKLIEAEAQLVDGHIQISIMDGGVIAQAKIKYKNNISLKQWEK